MDMHKARIESIRWHILVCANSGRPYPVAETLVLSAIQSIPIECTAHDLRREMDYLQDRALLDINRHEGAPWSVEITHHGVDLVEYNIPVLPGIARPKKYF